LFLSVEEELAELSFVTSLAPDALWFVELALVEADEEAVRSAKDAELGRLLACEQVAFTIVPVQVRDAVVVEARSL
jgi:hypothetical protein